MSNDFFQTRRRPRPNYKNRLYKAIATMIVAGLFASFNWIRRCGKEETTAVAVPQNQLINSADTKNSRKTFRSGEHVWVLALSWSPEFCYQKSKEGSSDKFSQCAENKAFVVHGLWPEKEVSHCLSENEISQRALQEASDVFADKGLMRHEWKKHGACSGLNSDEYFSKAEAAFRALNLETENSQEKTLDKESYLEELKKRNPSLNPQNVALMCSGRHLRELRVCLDSAFKMTACSSSLRSSCPRGTLVIR